MENMHAFEKVLCVSKEEIEFDLSAAGPMPWADFVLNPRRLRGSDFLMRWSQGAWSEERLVQAVNETNQFVAIPYGPSGVAPDHDVRAFELYFERLEEAGLGKIKRPDLLIFSSAIAPKIQQLIQTLGGTAELPFIPEEDQRMRELLSHALVAVECENSLWRAQQMPDFKTEMKAQKRLGGKPGLPKTAVLPTVILKDEDLAPLQEWQKKNLVPIHIWHVFYDMAFGLALQRAEELIRDGLILPTVQVFQAPGGATTKKAIFKIYYRYAYPLGTATQEPKLAADSITDKNGHILPYVKFVGGRLQLAAEGVAQLDALAKNQRT